MVNRRRRLLAAVLAAMAMTCLGLAIRPAATAEVLAAARDLPGGALSPADVTVIRLPEGTVPDGALPPAAPVDGRVLTSPARRGEPLTDVRLLGPSLVDAYGPGLLAAPVRITDASSAHLLRSGDVIDVIAAAPKWDDAVAPPTATVAQAVTVIAPPAATRTTDAMGDTGALVVLAATPDQATRLAQAATGSRLSIAIHGHRR
ncbi:hypothetical protein Ssi03_75520 [Sphaerisporangium siamense]|uniref:Flp pilus assembly protein CpaB n=1 Tax=Sphaerisporangium siamense TaxID=795645 RepID=A0A7W7D632_9ACTN|nr:RcpC/CpaB family pilus assembly protein [Sphaerisporangium siamense]MBB4700669.1 Flp pilus assembly protein CpaB [Sphaerisporangium siamense]GII89562.1 hypothetical protein Ssi03_75520 [Sphaerisporangium siamense]